MLTLQHQQIAQRFNACFLPTEHTRCVGGAVEPQYQPARGERAAELRYRADYAASALHEISHWCLAGVARRRLPDFGYRYAPAPRSLLAQVQFLRAEVRAQALESLLAEVAGVPFRCSYDDLEDQYLALRTGFANAVATTRAQLRKQGLPPRASRFISALPHRPRVVAL